MLFAEIFEDKLDIPTVSVGDEVKIGKFKNKKAIVFKI